MKAKGLKVQTLATPSAIESLVPEWRMLEGATPEANGFQSPGWRRAAGPWARMRFIAVREDGRLVLLAPLQVRRMFGVRAVCWLGEPLAQYGDILALPGPGRAAWLEAALTELRGWKDVDLIALGRVRADSALAACGLGLRPQYRVAETAPYVDLERARATRRRSIMRRMKRLDAFGPLRLERAADPEARRAAAAQALDFKNAWLARRKRYSSAFSAPGAVDVLLALAEGGVLEANRLYAGDRLVSIEIGLRSGAIYRSMIGAYDPDLAGAAPGHALTLRLLETLAAEGVRRFDFLPPGDHYKLAFAHGSVGMGAHFAPRNLRGAVAGFALERVRPAAKAVVYGAFDRLGAPAHALFRATRAFSRAWAPKADAAPTRSPKPY